MPEYIEGRIVDRDHVICPDNRIRKWYPNNCDPMEYESLFGLERGRVKLNGGVSVVGWRKDSDKRFLVEKGGVPKRFLGYLRRQEMWLDSAKSQVELQEMAKITRNKMYHAEQYELYKAEDKHGTLPPPDYSFRDEDPLPLPY